MESARPPLLLIVNGKPASGKTTLARRLAADLALPLFAKDDVKDTLFDAMGVSDRAWSRRLGAGSMATLRYITETLIASAQSLIVEANFSVELHTSFFQSLVARHGARVAQIWLTADSETLAQRFAARAATGERHPGHVELENIAEFRATLLRVDGAPLPLSGALLTVDTTDFATIRYDELLSTVRLVRDGAETTGQSF